MLIFISFQTQSQILCIFCWDQNEQISQNVNNLIVNGGFENTTCAFNSNANSFCPNSANYNCDIANWICTGGGLSTYSCFYDSNYWYVQEGTHSAYFGNSFCPPCNTGDTSCLVNTDCEVTGLSPGYPLNSATYGGALGISLEQTVTGLTSGATYVLEFWAGGESFGGGFPDKGLFGVDIGFGYTYLRCKPTESYTGVGSRYIIVFNATAASHTIKFTNWGHICFTCTELVLDDVRLYTLAEIDPIVPPCTGANVTALFTAPNHICPGTCTNFQNLSVNATSFQWFFPGANPAVSTDISPANICYNNPGSYGVTLIGTNGISTDTLTLNNFITVYPYPPAQGILQSGDTLYANQGAVSYQWYLDGNLIPGATNYYYVASGSGDYNVVATDLNGCEVEAVIYDVIAGYFFPAISAKDIKLFPNPVGDILELQASQTDLSGSEISIFNSQGSEVHGVSISKTAASTLSTDVSFLPGGIYWLQLQTSTQIFRTKFIKH